jgi:hypothetical protein
VDRNAPAKGPWSTFGGGALVIRADEMIDNNNLYGEAMSLTGRFCCESCR